MDHILRCVAKEPQDLPENWREEWKNAERRREAWRETIREAAHFFWGSGSWRFVASVAVLALFLAVLLITR